MQHDPYLKNENNKQLIGMLEELIGIGLEAQ
jgi:hypothetical protein